MGGVETVGGLRIRVEVSTGGLTTSVVSCFSMLWLGVVLSVSIGVGVVAVVVVVISMGSAGEGGEGEDGGGVGEEELSDRLEVEEVEEVEEGERKGEGGEGVVVELVRSGEASATSSAEGEGEGGSSSVGRLVVIPGIASGIGREGGDAEGRDEDGVGTRRAEVSGPACFPLLVA